MSELVFERGGHWPWLLAILPLCVALAFGMRALRRQAARYGAEPCDAPGPAWLRALRIGAVFALGGVAWLDPRLGEETVELERRGLEVVLCLDTSRSMLARDLEPSRLERAKRDIRALLPELAGGDRTSLVAFAGDARLVVPPTHDVDALRELLETVDTATVPRGGSNLAAALRRALELISAGGEPTATILLLTDGEDLDGEGLAAAREVADRGIVLHTIGYGSARGSKITLDASGGQSFLRGPDGSEVVSSLDADSLRQMAEATGGTFVRADTLALPLVELKHKRLDPRAQKVFESGEEVLRRPRFQWLLMPAMLLVFVEIVARGAAIGRAARRSLP
ncbi:MAG: VWA domain-containing protein [Planctomycetes bacterium]|nr:VWA domain-containing protein [Planctomycetota bacterium]